MAISNSNSIIKPFQIIVLTIFLSVLAGIGSVSFAVGPGPQNILSTSGQGDLRESLKGRPDILSVRKIGESYHVRYLIDKNAPDEIKSMHKRELKIFDTDKIKQLETALGPGSTGGGFSYYRAAMKNLITQLNWIIFKYQRVSENFFQKNIPEKFRQKLKPANIVNSIKKIRYSYFQDSMSVAPDGTLDKLDADIIQTPEGEQVILLANFFNSSNNSVATPAQNISMVRTLFHEITHLYGIGLDNDEDSYELSLYLVKLLIIDDVICGGVGTLEEQEAECGQFSKPGYQPLSAIDRYLVEHYWGNLGSYPGKFRVVDHHDYLCLSTSIRRGGVFSDRKRVNFEKLDQASALENLLPESWTLKQRAAFGFNTDCFNSYRPYAPNFNELAKLYVLRSGDNIEVNISVHEIVESLSDFKKNPKKYGQKICSRLKQANLYVNDDLNWTVTKVEKKTDDTSYYGDYVEYDLTCTSTIGK